MGVPPSPPPPPSAAPNHFLMVIQWTKAYCEKNNCPKGYQITFGDKFYIHGLWPKLASVRSGLKFDPMKLPSLTKDKIRLTKNWRSVESAGKTDIGAIMGLSSGFWSHEWEDHGRYQTLGQTEYFNFVLDRYDDLTHIHTDVVKTFHTRANVDVSVGDIIQYINSQHKVSVNISCLPFDTRGKKMVYEIYFNITLSGQLQNLTDQRNLHRDPCPDNMNVVFI